MWGKYFKMILYNVWKVGMWRVVCWFNCRGPLVWGLWLFWGSICSRVEVGSQGFVWNMVISIHYVYNGGKCDIYIYIWISVPSNKFGKSKGLCLAHLSTMSLSFYSYVGTNLKDLDWVGVSGGLDKYGLEEVLVYVVSVGCRHFLIIIEMDRDKTIH